MSYPLINQNLDIHSFMKMNPNNKRPGNKKGKADNAPEICSRPLLPVTVTTETEETAVLRARTSPALFWLPGQHQIRKHPSSTGTGQQ